MTNENALSIEWIDRDATSGPVFRLGADLAVREGAKELRICAQSTPSRAYRLGLEAAVAELVERWGTGLELVLDFEGRGPPQPGQALEMCRSLTSSGCVERITVVRKPWMPSSLVAAVLALIRASGTPVFVREQHE